MAPLITLLSFDRVLSLGVTNGHNIWKTDLSAVLDWIEPLAKLLGERLWVALSCSLLNVPVDLKSEQKLDAESKSWLTFAQQKLDELRLAGQGAARWPRFGQGRAGRQSECAGSAPPRVNNPVVQSAVAKIDANLSQRANVYPQRASKQAALLKLAAYPNHHHRLVPTDRRDPSRMQRIQGRASRQRRLQEDCHASRNRTAASANKKRWAWRAGPRRSRT